MTATLGKKKKKESSISLTFVVNRPTTKGGGIQIDKRETPRPKKLDARRLRWKGDQKGGGKTLVCGKKKNKERRKK